MRLTSALVITAICAAWGSLAGHPYLWLPYTGVAASVIDLFTRTWVASPKVGEWAAASVLLKFILALVGFYAMLAQFACAALGIYWIVRA